MSLRVVSEPDVVDRCPELRQGPDHAGKRHRRALDSGLQIGVLGSWLAAMASHRFDRHICALRRVYL